MNPTRGILPGGVSSPYKTARESPLPIPLYIRCSHCTYCTIVNIFPKEHISTYYISYMSYGKLLCCIMFNVLNLKLLKSL